MKTTGGMGQTIKGTGRGIKSASRHAKKRGDPVKTAGQAETKVYQMAQKSAIDSRRAAQAGKRRHSPLQDQRRQPGGWQEKL